MNELTCPTPRRSPLPTGYREVYRANRSTKIVFRPSDLRRISRYVACSHSPLEAFCAVLEGVGYSEEFQDAAILVDKMIKESDKFSTTRAGEVSELLSVPPGALLAMIKALVDFLRGSRIAMFVLRRLAIGPIILFILDLIVNMAVHIGDLNDTLKAVRMVFELIDCKGVLNEGRPEGGSGKSEET